MMAGLSARPTSWAMTYPRTSTAPVSRSTRTWTRWADVSGARTGGTVPPWPSSGSNAEVNPSSDSPIWARVRPRSGVPFGWTTPSTSSRSRTSISSELRRVGQDLLAQRVRGALDRPAGRVGDDAPAAHRRARRGSGVGGDDRHLVGRDAEALRGDRREPGHRARDVDHAGHDGDPSVGLEPADGRRRLPAARPRPDGETDPLAVRQRRAVAPERMRGDPVEALAEAESAPRRPVGHLVVRCDEVAAAELDGVDVEPPASSSMSCSSANVACVAPGAR